MNDDNGTMVGRAAVVRQLTAWVTELMPGHGAPVDEHASLTRAGFDSIATVQLLARAEDEFGVDLADQDQAIQSADSVGSLADTVVRLAGEGS
jgi:acyl carrier protein